MTLTKFKMPAEWELHEGTWISWPKDERTFPGKILEEVREGCLKMILALQEGEKVFLLVNNEQQENDVRKRLKTAKVPEHNIVFHRIKTVDVWTRDYVPIFVKGNNEVRAVKWVFNAWGNKYDDLKYDDKAGEEIAIATRRKVVKPGIVLEGGSIDVNGAGTLITTEQCLLNKNRNPHLNKGQIEQYMKDHLGIEKIIWLKEGVEGDDTDGHVDDIVRFVNEKTILCAYEDDEKDGNYRALKEHYELLQTTGFNIVKLPMPRRIEMDDRRLPASYANFYIGNSAVLLPVFNDENDKVAIKLMKKYFPGRKIVPINSTYLVYGYGGVHCSTMQQPG